MQLGRDAHGFQHYANVLCIELHSRHMEVCYFVFYTFQMSEIVIIKITSEMASNNTSKWEGNHQLIIIIEDWNASKCLSFSPMVILKKQAKVMVLKGTLNPSALPDDL